MESDKDWMCLLSPPRAEVDINSRKRSRFDFPVPLGPMTMLRSPGLQVTLLSERNPSISNCRIFME